MSDWESNQQSAFSSVRRRRPRFTLKRVIFLLFVKITKLKA
jgi:hypothetical protein